jgi:hypothetical protein
MLVENFCHFVATSLPASVITEGSGVFFAFVEREKGVLFRVR